MRGDPDDDTTNRPSVHSGIAETVLTPVAVVADIDVIVDVAISVVIVIVESLQETLSTSGVRYRVRSGNVTRYRRM